MSKPLGRLRCLSPREAWDGKATKVTMTLEIEAQMPDGASEQVGP